MATARPLSVVELDTPETWRSSERLQANVAPSPVERAANEARRHIAGSYSTDDLRRELKRSKRRRTFGRICSIIGVIALVVAAAVAAVMIVFSINGVSSSTMEPALKDGYVTLSEKSQTLNRGDVFAYRDGDGVSYSRVIAEPGMWVNIMSDGTLLVSEEQIEPSISRYTTETAINVRVSCQIPVGSYYALGDAQEATVDGLTESRDFIPVDQVIGKTILTIWPLGGVGVVS